LILLYTYDILIKKTFYFGRRKRGIPLLVIPDLIRNLAFTTPVTRVKLEILKQVQDDNFGAKKWASQ
jgi:hypothetical protein